MSSRTAAGIPAAVLFASLVAFAPPGAGLSEGAAPAAAADSSISCRITPTVLDVGRPAGPLTVRIEARPAPRGTQAPVLPARAIEPGVYIASVNGVRMPEPSAAVEGIGERLAGRSLEPAPQASPGSYQHDRGLVLVVRFDRPSDGNPATLEDGDAGDVLAMLMGVADGASAPVCVAGRIEGTPFECCDTIEVRNRGLRDLPRALQPAQSP